MLTVNQDNRRIRQWGTIKRRQQPRVPEFEVEEQERILAMSLNTTKARVTWTRLNSWALQEKAKLRTQLRVVEEAGAGWVGTSTQRELEGQWHLKYNRCLPKKK